MVHRSITSAGTLFMNALSVRKVIQAIRQGDDKKSVIKE